MSLQPVFRARLPDRPNLYIYFECCPRDTQLHPWCKYEAPRLSCRAQGTPTLGMVWGTSAALMPGAFGHQTVV
ncbi:hypothetical protein PtA15_5A452 [Puccinia triticina]|uniref:Uncharacterized protein n=1 Tax=Puccinia triticina TaxID=208348 RepID=A0ABY7CJM6_9BASI|nr:uncharacterized protein PtA15_5A452 [Puccinia triticina]WAQ84879.1 hypothetical protein PtA15_5A452 [Puccinia triticina]